MVVIDAAFDGGNIHCVDASNPADIRLEIARDRQSDFYQWFSFRVCAEAGDPIKLVITNAGGAAYPKGWENYRPVMSVDGKTWARIPAHYDGGTLTVDMTMPSPRVHLAYFAPYTLVQHDALISSAIATGRFGYQNLGQTVDGRAMDYLRYGGGNIPVWLIARQHPGESMAEWWMEGAFEMLSDAADPISAALADIATLHIIPNMNPDGSFRGHLRTNAVGVNLNRVWDTPDQERAPEVFHVRQKMEETGVDLCLDVHGDEALPYNFIAGFEGIPGITEAQLDGLNGYKALLAQLTPDFQTKIGYPATPPGKANLSMATNYIAHRFGAVAMTLEMPFKDTTDTPNPQTGWSPPRCKHLARHCLHALWLQLTGTNIPS